jgi:hypothetical protein
MRARVQWSVSKPWARAPWRSAASRSWSCWADRRRVGPVGPRLASAGSPPDCQRACQRLTFWRTTPRVRATSAWERPGGGPRARPPGDGLCACAAARLAGPGDQPPVSTVAAPGQPPPAGREVPVAGQDLTADVVVPHRPGAVSPHRCNGSQIVKRPNGQGSDTSGVSGSGFGPLPRVARLVLRPALSPIMTPSARTSNGEGTGDACLVGKQSYTRGRPPAASLPYCLLFSLG